jgi:hypothetical protein
MPEIWVFVAHFIPGNVVQERFRRGNVLKRPAAVARIASSSFAISSLKPRGFGGRKIAG